MLFDPAPKENKSDFYDREKELNEIIEALKFGERLIVIYGIRRIGKTSLTKVALKEINLPYILIDTREIFYNENSITMQNLVKYVIRGFKNYMKLYEKLGINMKEALKKIKRIHIKGLEIEITPNSNISLTEILSEINEWCSKHNMRFIFIFDEAQYLRYSNIRYDGILAWAIDNLSNISFILTGSEVGILKDFMRLNDPNAPLYDRYRREIYIDRFTKEQSTNFLIKGFKELNIEPNINDIEDTTNTLDGITGWLTYYGYYRTIRKLPHKEAINKVFEEGYKIVSNELEKIINPSKKRYIAILKSIAYGNTTWSDIKAYVTVRTGHITDTRLTELLKNLIKYGYITKENNEYKIPDPITKYVIEKL